MVRPDRLTDLPLIITRLANSVNPRVVPVCDDIIVEMEQFATSVSEISSANLTTAFQTGVGLFSSNSDTGIYSHIMIILDRIHSIYVCLQY